jgi:hypothetical protein
MLSAGTGVDQEILGADAKQQTIEAQLDPVSAICRHPLLPLPLRDLTEHNAAVDLECPIGQ